MKRRNHTWLFGESPCGPPRTATPPRTPKDPGGLISRPPHRDDHAEHEHRWRDNELISATPPTHPVGFRGGTCGHRQLVSKKRIVRTQNLVFSNPLGGVLPPCGSFHGVNRVSGGSPQPPGTRGKNNGIPRHAPATCNCDSPHRLGPMPGRKARCTAHQRRAAVDGLVT